MKREKTVKKEPRKKPSAPTVQSTECKSGVTLVKVTALKWSALRPLARALLRTPIFPGNPPTLLAWSRVGDKGSEKRSAWMVLGSAPYLEVTNILALSGVQFNEDTFSSQVRLTHGAVLTDPSGTGQRADVESRGLPLWTVTLGETRTMPVPPAQMTLMGEVEAAEPTVRVTSADAARGSVASLAPDMQPELGAWVLGCDGAPALLSEPIAPRYELRVSAAIGQWKKTPCHSLAEARREFDEHAADMAEDVRLRIVEANTGAVLTEAGLARDLSGCLVKRRVNHIVRAKSVSKCERIVVAKDAVRADGCWGRVESVEGVVVTIAVEEGRWAGRFELLTGGLKWKRGIVATSKKLGAWVVTRKAMKAARKLVSEVAA